MTKTEALKHARAAVSIAGRGTSWHLYGPYRSGNLKELQGPGTELTADSYEHARAKRTLWVASIALKLMDRYDEHAEYAVYGDIVHPPTIENIVDYALRG